VLRKQKGKNEKRGKGKREGEKRRGKRGKPAH
jgi:hypothetical protein